MWLNPFDRRVREHRGFPVAPGAFPFVGHIPAIVTDLPKLLQRAGRDLGSHFWLDFGTMGLELTCLSAETEPLLRNRVTTLALLEDLAPDIFANVLMAQEGELHRSLRAIMKGPFRFGPLTATGLGESFAGTIGQRLAGWADEGEVRVVPDTGDLALSLLFRLMGIEERAFSDWRRNYLRFTMLMVAPPVDLPGLPRPRGRRARAWIDARLRGFIDAARRDPHAEGFLADVVRAADAAGTVSDAHLVDNLRFMILAGHETTAATMAWAVVELARRPWVWDSLCEEAAAVGEIPCGPKDLARFPYAEAVFRETLRHHPAITLTKRRALVDFELGGRTVPAGANICVPLIAWAGHPDLYRRPEDFRPDRWLGRRETTKAAETLQFGGGPHFCLGYNLAWMEIVQFCVALALTMGSRGLRPRLASDLRAGRRYFPVCHPPTATRIVFAEG